MSDATTSTPIETKKTWMKHPLEYIAFWQFLCFGMLIALIWAVDAVSLSSTLFGVESHGTDWFGLSLVTAGVIIVAFVTIGHTYLQQRKALKDLITICSYCHDVRIETQVWQDVEKFITDKTLSELTHGICPTCYQKVMQELKADDPVAKSA